MSTDAVENLRNNQQQLDADGSQVGVSRQALEYTLERLELLEAALCGEFVLAGTVIERGCFWNHEAMNNWPADRTQVYFRIRRS